MTFVDKNKSERILSIDYARIVMAFLVIAIHTNPLEDICETANFIFVDIICSVAVPFFAISSGYFLVDHLNWIGERAQLDKKGIRKAILRDIKKLVILYIGWSLFYLPFRIYEWIHTGWFSVYAFVDWAIGIVIDASYYHLWYLICIVYAYLFLLIVLPYLRKKILFPLAIGIYLIAVIDYAYRIFFPVFFQHVFNFADTYGLIIFRGTPRLIPFIILGMIIKLEKKLTTRKCIVGFMICLILLTIEAFLLKAFDITRYGFIIMTFPTAYFLFGLINSIKLNDFNILGFQVKNISFVSMFVYCIHPAVIMFIGIMISNKLMLYFITVIISIIMANMYILVKRIICSFSRIERTN